MLRTAALATILAPRRHLLAEIGRPDDVAADPHAAAERLHLLQEETKHVGRKFRALKAVRGDFEMVEAGGGKLASILRVTGLSPALIARG